VQCACIASRGKNAPTLASCKFDKQAYLFVKRQATKKAIGSTMLAAHSNSTNSKQEAQLLLGQPTVRCYF